ncbi:MAG: cytochrome c oxidase subunit II [Propionibacteriaceae bacterium]|nr:cytochrome c oxidase subunit II [Propionibacteriaceae bacterium]
MASNRTSKAARRIAGAAAAIVGAVALSGCSQATMEQWGRWGLPEAASDRAPFIGDLWNGAWIASMVIGVFVWGLIGWAVIRYRRKSDADVPRQVKYNLPMEILYTLVPFLIIGVLFFFTVQAQNGVLAKESDDAVHKIDVIGQKWSWTFNYREADNPAIGVDAHTVGTVEEIPTLVMPLDKPVRFTLDSADVIHSFWIPDFYFKLDVIPGRTNSFDVTATKEGTFLGKCAELCGTYHAAMVFHVEVLPEAEYNARIQELAESGQSGALVMPEFPSTGPQQEG